MSMPDDVLSYALKQFKKQGIALNEGKLLPCTIEALNEAYDEDRERIKEFLPPEDAETIVQISYPQNFIADASELKRKLSLVPIDGGMWDIAKMGISIKMTAFNDGETIDSEPLNEFDKLVYQSICSYIDRGIGATDLEIESDLRFFTPAMIYENMNPGTGNSSGKPEAIERVRRSIDKLRHIKLTLVYDDFIKKVCKGKKAADQRDSLLKESRVEEEWLINAKRTPFRLNGEWVDGYRLNTVPPIYWKQKTIVRQLATYERKLLSPPGMRDKSGELLAIKHFILEHIQSMKNATTLSRKLKYDTIFERTGIVIETKKQAQRKRDQIKKYLDFLVTEGKIQGYTEYNEGQKLVGIEFCL